MAQYTIRTTRKQEIGLKYDYDTFGDKTAFPTQAEYFQFKIDSIVTNPMYDAQQRATSIAFDESFNTVPEAQQPAAKTEIETVIVAHGGTIIPVGGSSVIPGSLSPRPPLIGIPVVMGKPVRPDPLPSFSRPDGDEK